MKRKVALAAAGLAVLVVAAGIAEDSTEAGEETAAEPSPVAAIPADQAASTLSDQPIESVEATPTTTAPTPSPGENAAAEPSDEGQPPAESTTTEPGPEIPDIDPAEIEQMMSDIEALLSDLGQTMTQGDELP